MKDFVILDMGPFSKLALQKGIKSGHILLKYLKLLPYGRAKDRSDLLDVMISGRGTCSSKHAFFKSVADENRQDHIQLILGIYKMTHHNTPGIGDYIEQIGLPYIPEAHCFLKDQQGNYDLTSAHSTFERIKHDILVEQPITPIQVIAYKVNYHKEYLQVWINNNKLRYSLEEVWAIREKCIENLSL